MCQHMIDSLSDTYLSKAEDSFSGAESEFANARYDNCANRCYYACFQAAIATLISAAIHPVGHGSEWGHSFVHAQFSGALVRHRKLYPSELRDTLPNTLAIRHVADYRGNRVNAREASRSLRWARQFVTTVAEAGGDMV